jgi:hypothetical protein
MNTRKTAAAVGIAFALAAFGAQAADKPAPSHDSGTQHTVGTGPAVVVGVPFNDPANTRSPG